MPTPMPIPPAGSTSLGNLVHTFRGKMRYDYIICGTLGLLIAIFGSPVDIGIGTFTRVIFGVGAAFLAWEAYSSYRTNVEVLVSGFRISHLTGTAIVHWESIANIRHQVKRDYFLSYIPIPGTQAHDYIITLKNGKKTTLDGNVIRNTELLGTTIIQMWRQATHTPGSGTHSAS